MIFSLLVYKTDYGWAFDDESVGLKEEALVAGIDSMLDKLAEGAPYLELAVSDVPRLQADVDVQLYLYYQGSDEVEAQAWHEYASPELEMGGWLCPNLLKYFDTPPELIYVGIKRLQTKP